MKNIQTHWTEKSTADFLYRVGADFISQIEERLQSGPTLQKDLAERLGVTEAAVSQTLNRPSNLKLEKMIKYARALGMKISVVLYDDQDDKNTRGPIHSDIFIKCWEKAGKPIDFWALNVSQSMSFAYSSDGIGQKQEDYFLVTRKDSITANTTTDVGVLMGSADLSTATIYREMGHGGS